jgi:hypothetical protein
MFDQLVKRSDAVWIYSTGRFAEERRAFLCDLNERGYGWHTLRQTNKFLLVHRSVNKLYYSSAAGGVCASADVRLGTAWLLQ